MANVDRKVAPSTARPEPHDSDILRDNPADVRPEARYRRACAAFDTIAFHVFYGADFRGVLFENPEALQAAETLCDELRRDATVQEGDFEGRPRPVLACSHYGARGHVFPGPSYDRKPCKCGISFAKGGL